MDGAPGLVVFDLGLYELIAWEAVKQLESVGIRY